MLKLKLTQSSLAGAGTELGKNGLNRILYLVIMATNIEFHVICLWIQQKKLRSNNKSELLKVYLGI